MAKEKQVVKMAKVIEITEQIARDAHCGYPSPRMIASDLYDKGYCERSEVAREIFEDIKFALAQMGISFNDQPILYELEKKYTEGVNERSRS